MITGFEVFYFYKCNANFTFKQAFAFSSRTAIDGLLLKVTRSQKQFFLLSILQKIGWIRKVLIIPIRGYLSDKIKCFNFFNELQNCLNSNHGILFFWRIGGPPNQWHLCETNRGMVFQFLVHTTTYNTCYILFFLSQGIKVIVTCIDSFEYSWFIEQRLLKFYF